MVKVFGWYDNEWGYAARLVDLTHLVSAEADRHPVTWGAVDRDATGPPAGRTDRGSGSGRHRPRGAACRRLPVAEAVDVAAVALRLPTNPVHVLDLALFLPAVVTSGVLRLRRSARGYATAPGLLVFLGLTCLPVLATPVVRLARDQGPDWAPSSRSGSSWRRQQPCCVERCWRVRCG